MCNKLHYSQQKFLRRWKDILRWEILEISENGFLSSMPFLPVHIWNEIRKEISQLDMERETKYYKNSVPSFEKLQSLPLNRKFIRIVKNYIAPPILEVSCFNGWLAKSFRLSWKEYIGADPDPFYFNDEFLFIESAAELLPFKDGVFKTVISKDSLDHYIDLDRSMKEISRVCKKGGLFILSAS